MTPPCLGSTCSLLCISTGEDGSLACWERVAVIKGNHSHETQSCSVELHLLLLICTWYFLFSLDTVSQTMDMLNNQHFLLTCAGTQWLILHEVGVWQILVQSDSTCLEHFDSSEPVDFSLVILVSSECSMLLLSFNNCIYYWFTHMSVCQYVCLSVCTSVCHVWFVYQEKLLEQVNFHLNRNYTHGLVLICLLLYSHSSQVCSYPRCVEEPDVWCTALEFYAEGGQADPLALQTKCSCWWDTLFCLSSSCLFACLYVCLSTVIVWVRINPDRIVKKDISTSN